MKLRERAATGWYICLQTCFQIQIQMQKKLQPKYQDLISLQDVARESVTTLQWYIWLQTLKTHKDDDGKVVWKSIFFWIVFFVWKRRIEYNWKWRKLAQNFFLILFSASLPFEVKPSDYLVLVLLLVYNSSLLNWFIKLN